MEQSINVSFICSFNLSKCVFAALTEPPLRNYIKCDSKYDTDVKVGSVPSNQRQTFSSALSVRPIQK